jgi:hypothetical protein
LTAVERPSTLLPSLLRLLALGDGDAVDLAGERLRCCI